MITELRITDLGVIDDAVLALHPGLTVVTGETGAGKTMIVTSIDLLLGGRADAKAVRAGLKVIHISSHSFTPELNGEVRNTDIGLLYDPSRNLEQELCNRWRTRLGAHVPDLRVRRNYPYTGSANGFPTYLRQRFPADTYIGIELEINQKHILKGGWRWHALRSLLAATLNEAVA